MTIDELLAMASEYCGYIRQAEDRERVDHERVMRYAAIAQACAQTASAMIQQKWFVSQTELTISPWLGTTPA